MSDTLPPPPAPCAPGGGRDRRDRPLAERLRLAAASIRGPGDNGIAELMAEAAAAVVSLQERNNALRIFTGPPDRGAVGLSVGQVRHIRWAVAKGLCTTNAAADKLGIDRSALRSAVRLNA